MQRVARLSFRYPRLILTLCLIAFLLAGSYALKLDSVLQDHGLYPQHGQYAKVQQLLASDFNIADKPVMLLFEKTDEVAERRFSWFIEQTLLRINDMDGLNSVISPLERQGMQSGNYAYALLSFRYPPYQMAAVLEKLAERLPSYNGISIKVTGDSVVQADVNEASYHDLALAELIGIPFAFLLLWVLFRKLIAALLPIAIGVMGVTIAMGLMYGIGTRLSLSNFILNVIPMVGLALSIDFALVLVSRFREELSKGLLPVEALGVTMKTAGRAVFVSAATVFLGLLSIVWIPLPMFSSIALGAMTVVVVTLVLTYTLLPALLAICLPALYEKRGSPRIIHRASVWERLARVVMRRPISLGLIGGSLLILCLLPLASMRIAMPDETSLPQSYASRIAADTYAASFEPPSTSKVWVIVEGNTNFQRLSDWTEALNIAKRLEHDPAVVRVDSVFSALHLSPEQMLRIAKRPLQMKKYESVLQPLLKDNRMLLQVTLAGAPSSSTTMDWLRAWEKKGDGSPISISLGGEAKYQQEVFDQVFGSIGYVLLFLVISNFIVLVAAFRSILIAVKTILLNLLCISASYGILTWIFVEGRLGMEPSSIAIMIPVFIFGLVFGISMDYSVFLVSRIYEEYRRTGSNEQAVAGGLAAASKIITSAAAIMIAVTAPFAFAEVAGVKQLGIGIAAAIFIDATIIRMVLVPSLMSLFGKWNWWAPRWLKRLIHTE
ncbi:MMPL family protein [Paenibacillus sp. FSL H8-0548]|nr:MMPL family protein [Paenibacillus sp. FSL H8-0548]